MGRYWGHVDTENRLQAMAGERLHLDGHTEISAVCTHPDARGAGLAGALTRHVARAILERDETPFLHVADDNDGARRVYERLGFRRRRTVEFAYLETPSA
jgi:predicted GNAT family acetyltransferase